MTKRHLMLIGMMGAGKTAVGAECARRLHRTFMDLDEVVETTTARSVAEIFATDGEAAFRELERIALADACASPVPLVISTGGGAVLDSTSRRVARGCAVVIWLRAEPEELAARLAASIASGSRPLLATVDPVATIERLAALRADAYAAAADVVVDTGHRSVTEVADDVLEELARCAV